MKIALMENVLMAINDDNKHCWSHGLLRCLKRLGVIDEFSDVLQIDRVTPKKIDLESMNQGISNIIDIDWSFLATKDPRSLDDSQGAGIKCISYANWMRSGEDNSSPLYTKIMNNKADITCIARLRLRAHNLNVEAERSLSRSNRICRCCNMMIDGRRVVEDEMHFMLECPLYSEDRKLVFDKLKINPELLNKNSCMRALMNPDSFEGWKFLTKFIRSCDSKRKIKLDL